MTVKTFEIDYSGKKLTIEHGRFGHQAGAAVTVRMGDTMVMATATMSKSARPINFFPLMVDYEERYFAAGRIKGPRFSKREGRPSGQAVLTGRKIDRGLRPLFRQDMRNEVQVICLPLSMDGENRPDMIAMIAACTAVHLSNIPFDGPVVGVRVGMVNGDFVVNPTADELEYSDLVLEVMGDGERVTMVDCEAKEVPDEKVKEAFNVAIKAMGPLAKFIDEIRKEVGKDKATEEQLILKPGPGSDDQGLIEDLKAAAAPHLDKYLFNQPVGSKGERKRILSELKETLVDEFSKKLTNEDKTEEEARAYIEKLMGAFWFDFIEAQVTLAILNDDKRVDGRKLDQIRPLIAEVGMIPRVHGSGHFCRGETQILTFATLGAPGDDLLIETMEFDGKRKYFHHYNFLPYSVGECKPIRGAGRREIGHGALADKALAPVLPPGEEFPYTVRVVSEVMGSNGSSSMGATCGCSLALMDAGVPIKKHVAGIAMGLASDGERWKVLTDIQDLEDGPGGMDFKVTSTRDGITAIQMDTKTRGLAKETIEATFPQMRKAINELLDLLESAIPEPRSEISEYAPRIITVMIDPEKIGDVIGPGGKIIRGITEELDVQIDIEDDGTVLITSTNAENAQEAEKIVRDIVRVVEVGDEFEAAEVVRIMSFGAFVKLTPNIDALVHVSEIDWTHVEKVTDRLNLGDKVKVRVIKIDRGKVDASMKVFTPKPEGYVERPRRSRGPPRRGGDRGDRRRNDRRRS